MSDKEELRNAFEVVFDEKEDVRNCGRDACRRLMLIIKRYSPTADVGNINTGIMNVDVVKAEYHKHAD